MTLTGSLTFRPPAPPVCPDIGNRYPAIILLLLLQRLWQQQQQQQRWQQHCGRSSSSRGGCGSATYPGLVLLLGLGVKS